MGNWKGQVSALLDAADDQLKEEAEIEQALYIWRDNNTGFADCLIGARNTKLGCTATATLDGRAASLPGFATVQNAVLSYGHMKALPAYPWGRFLWSDLRMALWQNLGSG